MNHRLKALGLALIAVLALGGIAAAGAQAETPIVSELAAPNVTNLDVKDVTGTEDGKLARLGFGAGFRFIECTEARLTNAAIVGSATTVTATPNYEKCVENGKTPVTVTHNGCTATLTATKEKEGKVLGDVTIDCAAGGQIELHIYEGAAGHAANKSICTYDIKPQTLTGAEITSFGAGATRDLTVNLNALSTLKLTNTGPGGVATCSIAVNAEGTARFVGQMTVTGTNFNSGAQVGIFLG